MAAPRRACTAALPWMWALVALQGLWGSEARNPTLRSELDHSMEPSDVKRSPGHMGTKAPMYSRAVGTGLLQQEQAPDTSSKSWFQRLGDAIWSVLLGLFVLIPFSVALLWVNERRNAQLESLISLAQTEAQSIEAQQKDLADYDGRMVHLSSEMARGMEPIQDARFPDVKMASGCIKLMSRVEVYQWEEQVQEKTEKNSVGGGETTKKTYSYKQVWSQSIINSSSFHGGQGGGTQVKYENSVHVEGLDPGLREAVNSTVKYGEPYWLPPIMVQQLSNFEDAGKLVGDELKFGSYTFKRDGDYYLCPERKGAPQIGDFRVTVSYVLDGPASILALQTEDRMHEGGHTFAPYRAVSRGLCGVSEDELKQRLLAAAKKDADELYQEQKCLDFGPFACLCGCCNLVTYLFTHVQGGISLTPQICSAWSGEKSARECFDSEKTSGMAMKWGFRLLGWLLLWIGFTMLFAPLEVILDIIPFLGPYLGSGVSWVIGVFTFFLTIVVATLLVSIAYLLYHPLIGLLYLALTAGVVAGTTYIAHALDASHSKSH